MTDTAAALHDVARADQALIQAGLPLREGWVPRHIRREEHDGRPVTVVRFLKEARPGEGVHLTVVLDDDGVLLGYTRLDPEDPSLAGPLPAEHEAREAAFAFVTAFDPAYAAGLTVQWIARHDEHVAGPDGPAVVSGVKVKTRHRDGLYAWVVIGPGGTVLTYERDIRWDAVAGRRGTQMWLHDVWIAAREGRGPQPSSPYALA
ncbi:hypothetical protein [Streptomyces specialis]|uniref:hypothetical protein n=1 Tax=Streptomyces specialis TaxID=498367 RepID=UPI00073F17F2|nr:hypothetical protein [Streptomyces specialis]